MNYETKIVEIIEKIRQCDDFHNRCDYLLEHDEATYLIDYITQLDTENNKLKDILAKIKDLNTMQYLDDKNFKYSLNEILKIHDEKEGEENVK